MRTHPLRSSHVQLGAIFVLLVLLPSFLLGYFSLRAVDNERLVSKQRLLADRARYAEFAARAVHRELESLEDVWEGLVPRRVGWDRDLQTMTAQLAAAQGQAYVRTSHLLHVSGGQLYPRPAEAAPVTTLPLDALEADEAERIQELLDAGEAAEFDTDQPEAALAAYTSLLEIVRAPRLRAIAHAGLGRAHMRLSHWQAAIQEFRLVLEQYPDAHDLDNQPLRLQAWLHTARAREEMGERLPAAAALVSLYENLVDHSDEIGRLQYDIFVERIEERMARLVPRPLPDEWRDVETRFQKLRGREKKPVGSAYFAQKLSRKLIRASLDGLSYSTQVRYLSDSVDGAPFLLAYLYLPDASGTLVAGLVGFEIDLGELSKALLPGVLQELEPSADVSLALVDAAGNTVVGGGTGAADGTDAAKLGERGKPVSGSATDAASSDRATRELGAPFDFWSIAVTSRAPAAAARNLDFRTKVFLYLVLLLLVTIVVGAVAVVRGLRRESRLASLKTGFVSSVTHELRTPLTSIRMFTEMLEENDERTSPEQRKDYLRTIRRECGRLQRLIEQVLDFARSERGTAQYRFEYEEIGSLVHSIAEEFRAQAEAEGFAYTVEIEPDLPELRLDRDAVRQMLLNLLANAVQYSDTTRAITVRAWRRGDEIGVAVQDRGVGIEAGERARIFEDFYRGETRVSGRHSGLGLGLALVRRVTAAHAARIQVTSRRDEGSAFTIWFPVVDTAAAPARERAQLSSSRNEGANG